MRELVLFFTSLLVCVVLGLVLLTDQRLTRQDRELLCVERRAQVAAYADRPELRESEWRVLEADRAYVQRWCR